MTIQTTEDFGLTVGSPGIESVGPITFGPGDLLFIADNKRARVVAVDVADPSTSLASGPLDLADLDGRLASFLGCDVSDVAIRDMAVHPRTGNVYLSVTHDAGDAVVPVIVRVDHLDGTITDVTLEDVAFSETDITNAPAEDDTRRDVRLGEGEEIEFNGKKFRVARIPARMATITDMAYIDGNLLVAGMSSEEFSSNLRSIPFPFTGDLSGTTLEIFHVAHGMWETAAPIRTFTPYRDGTSILASYTCTPLVHFPLSDLVPGGHAKGRTVAELGAGNQPIDIVSFTKDGADYVLVSHSSHPLMKIACADIDVQEALTQPQEPVGVPHDNPDLSGISLMAKLDDDHVLAVQTDAGGARHLRSLKTASL